MLNDDIFFLLVAGSPCEHDGICVNTPGSFACNCTQGFTGPRCETNVNECESHPCQNDGSCLDDPGTFRCVCMPGKCSVSLYILSHDTPEQLYVFFDIVVFCSFLFRELRCTSCEQRKKHWIIFSLPRVTANASRLKRTCAAFTMAILFQILFTSMQIASIYRFHTFRPFCFSVVSQKVCRESCNYLWKYRLLSNSTSLVLFSMIFTFFV